MQENKIKHPLFILLLTAVLLIAISFFKYEIPFEEVNFKIQSVDLLSDIKIEEPVEPTSFSTSKPQEYNMAAFALPSFLFASKNDNLELPSLPVQNVGVSIEGNTKQLLNFFEAVKLAKTKNVRIAHFGDSIIEGDLISADVRETFQGKFGGNGAGWMGIVSQDIAFRTTTKHTFSTGNWEAASLYTSNPKSFPLGISGEANIPKGNAWVQYETTSAKRYLKDFSSAKLYYANAKASSINYTFDDGVKQTIPLKVAPGIQELILLPKSKPKSKSVKIEFPMPDQAVVYGVSLENEPGVYLDNFPLRGNSGVDLQQLNVNTLKEFAKYLDYKLIILEFGLNIAGSKDYSWYNREMTKVINNFKTAFPKASIVMVSVHDRSSKKGTEFVTDPSILSLIETQRAIAKQNDIAIWSLFDAMGGANSMNNWVNANPPLAYKDYIHFNDQGARKVAQLFSDALIKEMNKPR